MEKKNIANRPWQEILAQSLAAISKENAGEIPDVNMDKKYVNPKAVKEPKIYSDTNVCQWKV